MEEAWGKIKSHADLSSTLGMVQRTALSSVTRRWTGKG